MSHIAQGNIAQQIFPDYSVISTDGILLMLAARTQDYEAQSATERGIVCNTEIALEERVRHFFENALPNFYFQHTMEFTLAMRELFQRNLSVIEAATTVVYALKIEEISEQVRWTQRVLGEARVQQVQAHLADREKAGR